MRIALHSVIRDGHEDAYVDDHRTIPDDLVDSFARVGIHEWTIWRSGRGLFHVVECENFAAAMAELESDPANQRWQSFIGRHVAHFVTTSDGPEGMPMPQVWSLAEQTGTPADRG